MENTFKDIYLPVKSGITGEILGEKHYINSTELQNSISVIYNPLKPIGKWCIKLSLFNKGQFKTLWYGKTIKEIKTLIRDINDFKFDPYLFLNL